MAGDFCVKDVLMLCVDLDIPAASPSTVDEFVTALSEKGNRHDERRAANRKPLTLDVIAVPLDDKFVPIGEPFVALTRNISPGGISLVHTEQISTPYLLLRMETRRHQKLQVIVQVLKSRSFYQFSEISARFVSEAVETAAAVKVREGKPPAARPQKRRRRVATK